MSEQTSLAPDQEQKGRLRRTIGLPGALAIGVGTMVGAGIFVFPGLVAERVGALGLVAFLIAGAVATIVAIYTAELATAMPVSGGGYTFSERVLGRFPGAVVGLAQWVGLIFAAAFYLASFGTYLAELLTQAGHPGAPWARHLVPAMALALTFVNMVGSGKAGSLQKYLVIVLTIALTSLFIYGLFHLVGPGDTRTAGPLSADASWTAVITTAAMIFTAYIGFVQIATVGGEIRKPEKNLPRALIGSVIIVLALYLLIFYVSIMAVEPETLGSYGETAVVEVSRILIGITGVVIVLGAGLLATASSANASILSSSRTLYALARDGHVPSLFARVWKRFHSPYAAILAVGLPAAMLSYLQTQRLAEIASLLHLVVYGLICFSVGKLRLEKPDDYQPSFKAPGPTVMAFMAGLACIALIGFMDPASMLAGTGILVVAAIAHLLFRRHLD